MKWKIMGYTVKGDRIEPAWIEAKTSKEAISIYKERTKADQIYLETTEEGIEKPD